MSEPRIITETERLDWLIAEVRKFVRIFGYTGLDRKQIDAAIKKDQKAR